MFAFTTTILFIDISQEKQLSGGCFFVLFWGGCLWFHLLVVGGGGIGVLISAKSFQVGMWKKMNILLRNIRSYRLCTIISKNTIAQGLIYFQIK